MEQLPTSVISLKVTDTISCLIFFFFFTKVVSFQIELFHISGRKSSYISHIQKDSDNGKHGSNTLSGNWRKYFSWYIIHFLEQVIDCVTYTHLDINKRGKHDKGTALPQQQHTRQYGIHSQLRLQYYIHSKVSSVVFNGAMTTERNSYQKRAAKWQLVTHLSQKCDLHQVILYSETARWNSHCISYGEQPTI